MKNAIIIHGWPSKEEYFDPASPSPSNRHWLPWLQHQLILNGINAQTPEMPEAYIPIYEKWASVFNQFTIDEGTILVGHSCGGGFLLRWLSENNQKVGNVVLVAPWLDPKKELDTGFFDFGLDEKFTERVRKIIVMYSTDDEKVILETVSILKKKLKNVSFQEFTDKGHFTSDDLGTNELPELLKNLLEK